MNINLDKTLEQLDNEIWEEPGDTTNLVIKIHRLRKKPLKEFTTEDLRIVIGQSFYLEYLIPLAIERLSENILSEGDFYPGDLLKNVLDSDKQFWLKHKDYWLTIKNLFEKNRHIFEQDNTFRQLRKSYDIFEAISK